MTVLVPYDGSDQAEFALRTAVERFPDSEMTLLHVIQPYSEQTTVGGYGVQQYDRAQEDAERLLETAVDSVSAPMEIETEVRYGRPVHEIIHYTETNRITHIVMGSHGREGAARLLLGSVAETVVRRASVPVTVVRKPESATAGVPEDVLVPFDGSPESERALSHALEQYPDATVTALYILYPPREVTGETAEGRGDAVEDWSEQMDDHAQNILGMATTIAEENERAVRTETTGGDPARGVVDYAEDHQVDHIVMGSHGRDGLSRLLIGSVAETVVRRAPTSVTVVR